MTIYVTELARGGYSAHGGCYYDPRPPSEGGRYVKLEVFDDEVIDVVAEFLSAPTETDYEEDGIDISTPVISGNTIAFQIQGLSASGTASVLVMFTSGAAKRVNFMANALQPVSQGSITTTDDDDVDYGAWG